MARIGGKTAFVFTGGGSLGAIQVGMLRVLSSAGVQPDFVVGASVGAINAGSYELERIPEDIHVHLMPTLCPLAVSPFDFSASRELVERAAQSSKKWMEEGGLTRRARPQELAPHRH